MLIKKVERTTGISFWILAVMLHLTFTVSSYEVFPADIFLNNLLTYRTVTDHSSVFNQNLFLDEPVRLRKRRQSPSSFFMKEYEDCLSQPSCSAINNVTSIASGEKNVLYVATRTQILEVSFDRDSEFKCLCKILHSRASQVISIVLDDAYIYWLNNLRSEVLHLSIKNENRVLSHSLSPEMLAEDKQLHRAACRIPTYIPAAPYPYRVSNNFAVFNLSEINAKQHEWFNSTICLHERNPNITFAFLFKKISHTNLEKGIPVQASCLHVSECFYKRITRGSNPSYVRLNNLSSNSVYSVHLVIYSQSSHYRSAVILPPIRFTTSCEASFRPYDLRCRGVNETALRLFWVSLRHKVSAAIFYEIYVNDDAQPLTKIYAADTVDGNFSYVHDNLQHREYNYTIRTVLPSNCTFSNATQTESVVNYCSPLQPPAELIVERTTDMQAVVFWKTPSDASVHVVLVEWITVEELKVSEKWGTSLPIAGNESFRYTITDLIPNTGYSFRTRQQYIGHQGNDGWRYSSPVNGITMPGVPAFPKDVKISKKSSKNAHLTWGAPNDNGSVLKYYIISYRNRSSPNATRILFGLWTTINNSARSTQWKVQSLENGQWYEFRVSAVNEVGEGDASKPSPAFQYFEPKDFSGDVTLYIVVGVTVGIIMIAIIIIICACIRCGKVVSTTQSPQSSEITTIHLSYGADLQLAQVRHMAELASSRGVSSVPQDYMDLLPLFPREKLTLTEFLGKGAFGEVFRGIAKDVDGILGTEKRVAVKTLREGSTDREKCEFLMEAYFMSTFHHKNILSLHSVCLDNEPQYLILELMDGGDLLHYLRDARPNPIMEPKLTQTELIDICLDVAAGCKYLEEQRFIHRDLAARNCLVSTKLHQPEPRVVKIGDFGLARDIYKNDYYHKAGEGLLPVRWMAPESLLDNIYSTQSDVWAFGILLWEILTYGQQPYPALTNFEVLQHVRTGGRLSIPENCPNDIYALMMKCWHRTSSLRPSFSWALQWLTEFKVRGVIGPASSSHVDVNYAIVTTSEEDFMDMVEPHLPPTLISNRSHLTECYDNGVFDSQESIVSEARDCEDLTDLDSDDVATTSMDIRLSMPDITQSSNMNSYLRISAETPGFLLTGSTSSRQLNIDLEESSDEAVSIDENDFSDNASSISDLNNDSSQRNVARVSQENDVESEFSLAGARSSAGSQSSHLLPYIGDLPITDEERIKRKQEWNRQKRLHTLRMDDDTSGSEEIEYTTPQIYSSPMLRVAHVHHISLLHENL